MKLPPTHASPLLRAALAAVLPLLSSVVPLRAAGEADFTFGGGTFAANSVTHTIGLQPDGKIMVGGGSLPYLKRFDANGVTDPSFNASLALNNWVENVEVAPDGKIYAGGNFTSIGGGARSFFARLNSNGSLDTSFTVTADEKMYDMGFLPDGKVAVAGNFASIGGQALKGFARLDSAGSIEPGYGGTDSAGRCTVPLPDGRVLLSGFFTAAGGAPRQSTALFSPTGVLAPFNPLGANTYSTQIAMQPDGQILVLEWNAPNYRVRRYAQDGTRDTSYNATINGQAWDMAVQCDGKVIVVGEFNVANGVSFGRMARFNADGSLDTTFYNNAGNFSIFRSVALQPDGKILVGGSYSSVGGGGTGSFARLLNDPAVSTLTNTASRVEWLRGGSAPEANWVAFDQSIDSGASWTPLGLAARISGGWELTGLSIPSGALVRGRACTRDGFIVQNPPIPDIAIEQPAGTDLVDGTATIGYGTVFTGSTLAKGFTIKNTGNTPLTVTGVAPSGGDSGDFTVSAPAMPLSVAAGGSATFTVTFAPVAAGARSTTLQILSDDADEATFDIALTGTGVAAPEIAVEHPVGTDVPRFSTITMGSFTEGSSSPPKTFTLKNTGSGTLNVTSMVMSSGNNADFTLGTPGLPFSVAPSGSVTFTATFTPLGIGARSAYITIGNNDANENPFYVQLAGTGLEVVDSAPVITSGLTRSAFISNFFSYQITATDAATVFAAAPLPPGLTLNSSTGEITGSPTATGVYNITISASNAAFGMGPTATLVLTITDPLAPLKEAIELTPGIPMSTSGTWTAQTAVTHDGVDAITASPNWFDFARITFNVQGPATFSCWWKANSGDASNSAWIRLDGFAATIASISAENSAWQQVEYAIPAGAHTVEITMDRFSGTFGSAATIWLDEVSFVFPSPDGDTDGLPDAWEVANFGGTGATDGAADADGDGLNNFGEYAFGLNPNSGDLTGLPQATLSGGLMTLTVTKQPYVAYTVEATGDLSAGSWSTAGLTVVTDDSTTLTVQETATTTRRQLRVRAVPAP